MERCRDDTLDAEGVVQGSQSQRQAGHSAVGVRDQGAVPRLALHHLEMVAVDLGDHEWNIATHPVGRGVAYDHVPGLGQADLYVAGCARGEGGQEEGGLPLRVRGAQAKGGRLGRKSAGGHPLPEGLPGRRRRSAHLGQTEPGVAVQELDELLAYRSRRSQNS